MRLYLNLYHSMNTAGINMQIEIKGYKGVQVVSLLSLDPVLTMLFELGLSYFEYLR